MNLYTADLHFGHNNIIKHDHRPFFDTEEMDKCLIDLWNGRVYKDDTVYIIGDFCFKNGKPEEWYLKQLKGHKILIIGNHDTELFKNPTAMSYFEDVQQILTISDQDKRICLCHYPLAEWDGYYHGVWHIYGHIHNNKNEAYSVMKDKERALNAGCMINNYTPVSFKELYENNQRYKNEAS